MKNKNDRVFLPWQVKLTVFRLHIINIFLKKEYSLEKIYAMLEQAFNDPTEEIKEIVSSLEKEMLSKPISVTRRYS